MLDLLLQNVSLLDLSDGTVRRCDVAVTQGQVAHVAPSSPRSPEVDHARQCIDCTGAYLLPGLIDLHVHLFAHGSTFGLDADLLPTAGVVRAVDMGSAGWVNYPAFRQCDITGKQIPIRSFLNLSPIGQPGKGIAEPLDPELTTLEDIRRIIDRFPGEILGLKVRISRSIVGARGVEPLIRAIRFGESLGLPVCVHTTDPPIPAGQIAALLRPGDLYSHVYHGQGETVLAPDGHVWAELLAAQRRGVLMDVGNGKKNFDLTVARTAMAQGLFPDLITSDATPTTFHQDQSMWDLPFVMSKFLALGMPLHQVVRATTTLPARLLDGPAIPDQLAVGTAADLTLLRLEEGPVRFLDSSGAPLDGHQLLRPLLTLVKGQVLFSALP